MSAEQWWRSAVIYQVYPRSFADSDGDGVGDLPGIRSHVDHLVHLGVDAVWLSPVYRSPMEDMGYDVADYRAIDPTFGTEQDFDLLVDALHEHGIRLIMDVVFNHTSAEHPWFVRSRSSRADAQRDWYVWRDARPGFEPGQPGAEPNNWESFFGGPAWTFDPTTGQYYLHLFAPGQPDLNWENVAVREAVADVLRFWLGRGVDGFRMDVINLVSKVQSFADGVVGPNGLGDGYPYYGNGPRVHEFLRELRAAVGADVLLIAETPGASTVDGERYTDPDRAEVDMLFQFEHVGLDAGATKWEPREVAVADLVDNLRRWQREIGAGWNALYWSNHDQPRIASRFGDPAHWRDSATALATLLHLQRGTPFIYQGEEIGATNFPFTDPDQFRDVESVNALAELRARGAGEADALASVARMSRDNARIPMAWSADAGGGFSTGEPWLPVHPDHGRINVAAQREDESSVLAYYRRLIELRHREPIVAAGEVEVHDPIDADVVWFSRSLGDRSLEVYVNLSSRRRLVPAAARGVVELSNLPVAGEWLTLEPWQAVVVRVGTQG
jgi:oligo-1,6-glucosidase